MMVRGKGPFPLSRGADIYSEVILPVWISRTKSPHAVLGKDNTARLGFFVSRTRIIGFWPATSTQLVPADHELIRQSRADRQTDMDPPC
jgi:hypothetical protein